MSPKEHDDIMSNLEGSFAVEGISISPEIKEELKSVSENKTTVDAVLTDLIEKYRATE